MDTEEILVMVALVAAAGLILLHKRPVSNQDTTPSQAILADIAGVPANDFISGPADLIAAWPYFQSSPITNILPSQVAARTVAVGSRGGCHGCRG